MSKVILVECFFFSAKLRIDKGILGDPGADNRGESK